MATTDLKTRRKEILTKLFTGQKLLHYNGWPGRMSEHASLEADNGVNGSDSYIHIGVVDYKWLMKKNYIKQIDYEWGGKSTYSLSDAGRMYWKELK